MNTNKAVFLDRDGIIVEDTGFPGAVGEVIVIEHAESAVKVLNELNYLVVVITNQSAVARGFTDEAGVKKTNQEISEYFLSNGARIDGFYYCPHLPGGAIEQYAIECDCRKPEPGMLLKAANDHNIDMSRSFFIGDSERDVQAAVKAGAMPILVSRTISMSPDVPSFADLAGAVNYIIDKNET